MDLDKPLIDFVAWRARWACRHAGGEVVGHRAAVTGRWPAAGRNWST
jgi:hypothetical protein